MCQFSESVRVLHCHAGLGSQMSAHVGKEVDGLELKWPLFVNTYCYAFVCVFNISPYDFSLDATRCKALGPIVTLKNEYHGPGLLSLNECFLEIAGALGLSP